MNFFVQRSELRDLYDKVAAGERISEPDALRLFESKDLNTLGAIADLVRQRKVGNRASYIINRYLNYSNYCILSCQFCSFARKKRDADGFHGIAYRGRPASFIAVQLLHRHVASLARAGLAAPIEMFHCRRDFASRVAREKIRV